MNLFDSIREFIRKIDAKSWPAFFMFAVVLLAAGALNYVGMSPTFGSFVAITVASFFGVGVLSWHIVESRTDDSEYQEQVALVAKWITVALDAALLVVNFVRIETQSYGWDIAAYVIISLAAGVHVVGYLLWTQNDPRRINTRNRERALFIIERKGDEAQNVIATTRKKLAAHKFVVEEEANLRAQYANVDPAIVEDLVAKMKRDYAAKMEELEKAVPTPSRPQNAPKQPQERQQATLRPASAVYHAETPQVAEKPQNPTEGRS